MKTYLLIPLYYFLFISSARSQNGPVQTASQRMDSSNPPLVAAKNPPPVHVQAIAPVISFNEHPVNHNMHITCDGVNYYTINGGNSGTGQINQFDLGGNLLQTYPIQIDGRGLSYNPADSFLYASLFMGDIVKITNLAGGAFITVFPSAMHDAQASFAISPDGSKFYDFASGTLYVHDFATGVITDTLIGLSFGPGNFGGNAAVAVDSNYIYTCDASTKNVYIYDQLGSLVQTLPLDSGDNGHALSIANNLLFISKDGNYNTGTWYGYSLYGGSTPVAGLSSTDSTLCEKQTIDFYDLSTNNPTSWHWYFPNASPDTSTLQNPTAIYYNAYGTYDVALVACNANGCDSLFLPGFITVFQSPPQPTITLSNDTLFCSPAFTYAWYESTNPSLILSTDSFYVTTQNGNYFVIVTDSNGCAVASNILLINTGVAYQTNDLKITLYPNPASGLMYIELFDNVLRARLEILDIHGERIRSYQLKEGQNEVDISSLAKGMYFLKISAGDKYSYHKIMILNEDIHTLH